MRTLSLAKSGLNKLRSHQTELKGSDVEDSIKSLPPGEWCLVKTPQGDNHWVAFVNPLVAEKFSSIMIMKPIEKDEIASFSPESFVLSKIKQAYDRRFLFYGYEQGARMCYGTSDGLPGLIIDAFVNAVIIQINTAGLDRYRESIKQYVSHLMKKDAYLLDNAKYREKEALPTFESPSLPDLEVLENGLRYQLRAEVIQKVGFYYDHRENRSQLIHLLGKLDFKREKGLDLFSYAGSWGLSALKAGVKHIDFVDQGDFSAEVKKALELNGFHDRGSFIRGDVFKFLDECTNKKEVYDLILCDPPAFAKNALQKNQALDGYSKLHRKVFKISHAQSLCVFSSCTHYVSHEEFQKNILDAAHKEGKRIQLLYSGIQGWDHPISSLQDRANYIKSYFYIVEN